MKAATILLSIAALAAQASPVPKRTDPASLLANLQQIIANIEKEFQHILGNLPRSAPLDQRAPGLPEDVAALENLLQEVGRTVGILINGRSAEPEPAINPFAAVDGGLVGLESGVNSAVYHAEEAVEDVSNGAGSLVGSALSGILPRNPEPAPQFAGGAAVNLLDKLDVQANAVDLDPDFDVTLDLNLKPREAEPEPAPQLDLAVGLGDIVDLGLGITGEIEADLGVLTPKREPEAEPEAAVPRGSYGKYASYGKYKGAGANLPSYASYGKYPRAAEEKAA